MTTHYFDLTVLPDPETSAAQLMNVLFGKLHLVLVGLRSSTVGVCFPAYSLKPRSLGKVLRVFGGADELTALMQQALLAGLRDYLEIGEVTTVPADTRFRCVSRKQFKTNVERLRRRRMKRKGETYEQAKFAIPDSAEHKTDLPFVNLTSRSTGQKFSLFIAQGELQSMPITRSFNTYGLAEEGATVPWF